MSGRPERIISDETTALRSGLLFGESPFWDGFDCLEHGNVRIVFIRNFGTYFGGSRPNKHEKYDQEFVFANFIIFSAQQIYKMIQKSQDIKNR